MPLRLSFDVVTLHTRHPFIIARGGRSEYQVVWVRVSDGDGTEGWGEAYPSSYYGESLEGVQAALRRVAPQLPTDPFDLEGAESSLAVGDVFKGFYEKFLPHFSGSAIRARRRAFCERALFSRSA